MIKMIRRAFVAIAGGLIVLLGLVGFALPVLPGTALLVGGLLLWSTEFRWAQEVLARARAWIMGQSSKGKGLHFRHLAGKVGSAHGAERFGVTNRLG